MFNMNAFKKTVALLLLCISVAALVGCQGNNSADCKCECKLAELLCNEKYHCANKYGKEWLTFYTDGTGELVYQEYSFESEQYLPKTRKFKYVLTNQGTVHCFNDQEPNDDWNLWFNVIDGILLDRDGLQYVSQSTLEQFPKFEYSDR